MTTERQRERRRKTFLKTELAAGDNQANGHLLNVSTGGALVYRDPPPERGQQIRIWFAGAMRMASVRWVKEGHFGIQFFNPIPTHEVSQALAKKDSGARREAAAGD